MSQSANPSRRNTIRSNEQVSSDPTSRSQTGDASSSSRRNSNRRNEQENTANNNNTSQSLSPSSVAPPTQTAGFLFRTPQFGGTHNTQAIGHQGNIPQNILGRVSQSELGAYEFAPGGPLVWDWDSNMDFPNFTAFYEPQGQLTAQPNVQAQQSFLSDFDTPYRVIPNPNFQPTTTSQNAAAPFPATLPQGQSAPAQLQTAEANAAMASRPSISESSVQGPPARAGMKRKADSDGTPSGFTANASAGPAAAAAKRASISRPPSQPVQPAPSRPPPPTRTQSQAQVAATPQSQASSDAGSPGSIAPQPPAESGTSSSKRPSDVDQKTVTAEASNSAQKKPATELLGATVDGRKIAEIPKFASVLPAGKVFPIQIGSELFRLSGASISSDAPSYFSHYFGEQLLQTAGRPSAIKTLYIDRDPHTFKDICLHLQGMSKGSDEYQSVMY
jgi:hypothetical protein